MIQYIYIHTIIHPVLEYIIHYTVHKTDNSFHKEHHNCVTQNKLKLLTLEYWCITCITVCLIMRIYSLSSMFMRYWLFHQYIHKNWGNESNSYVKHHMIHHRKSRYNYGVSSMWVDKLLGTYCNQKD